MKTTYSTPFSLSTEQKLLPVTLFIVVLLLLLSIRSRKTIRLKWLIAETGNSSLVYIRRRLKI